MKAVIMAGGEGTRLRPLTCNLPKPLAPLCGKPVVEYILELLKKHNFMDVAFTLRYQGDKIVSHFDDNSYNGVSLSYSFESEPLGTAGSIKKAVGTSDEVLVISGDAMCDFNLTSAIEFHKKSNAKATIIVKKVSDPREYGLILADDNGRVRSFLEKPSYESCITDLANTGVYILSREALELIPDGEADFAQDIFPKMLKQGLDIYAFQDTGYWCDIGDFYSFIQCQRDILDGLVDCEIDGHKTLDGIITNSTSEFKGARITPPVFIGRNVKIASGAVIDAGSVISDDVTICRGAKIHGGILLDGVYIGEKVTCNEAVICENAKLLSSSAVYEGGIVGENAVICENSIVEAGVKIWAGKHLDSNTVATYDIKYGHAKQLCIDDEGVCGETNGEITPQVASVLGSSIASSGKKIGIGYKGTPPARALAYALISGIMSAGGEAWNVGECLETELDFAMRNASLDLGCYVDSGVITKLKIISENGLPLTRKQERKIEAGLNRSEYNKVGFNDFGNLIDVPSLRDLYANELSSIVPKKLNGIKAEVNTSNPRISEVCNRVLNPINDKSGERIVFHISSDGRKMSAFTEDLGYVFYEKLILLCCQSYFQKGEDVAMPYSAPAIADELAKRYGSTVFRYYNCPVDNSDIEARTLASKILFTRDALTMMLVLLNNLTERKISLAQAIEELPKFTATNRFVSIEKSPSAVLKSLCNERGGLNEGVIASDNYGRVLIRPVKTGKGVMMFVESFKSETATEICDFYEKLLTDKTKE